MITEVYTSLENTMKYNKFGSHVPFNFKFITDVNNLSKAADFKRSINDWISQTPNDGIPNWVVSKIYYMHLFLRQYKWVIVINSIF